MTRPPSRDRLTVAVIDDDAIFRLGVCSWLQGQGITVALDGFIADGAVVDRSGAALQGQLDLVLYGLPRSPGALRAGLRALQDLTPAPVLGLGPADPGLALQLQQSGGQGYWVKGDDPQGLLGAMGRVAAGGEAWSVPYWQQPAGWIAPWRQRLYASGMRQIEVAIADLERLSTAPLTPLDRAIVDGRQRELRAARGLVTWLIGPRVTPRPMAGNAPPAAAQSTAGASPAPQPLASQAASLTPEAAGGSLVLGGAQVTLFDALDTKLQSPLRNQTRRPLEIDILREERRRELLYAVRNTFAALLTELRQADVQPAQVIDPSLETGGGTSRLLQDLWQRVVTQFFGKYYVISIDGVELEVVPLLLLEAERVRPDLEAISGVSELVGHLLFQHPLQVDSVPHSVGSATAMARAELLLDNMVIRVANAVAQPLLNQLADVEVIKQSFYSRQLLSSRSIAQFRNDLSWHYRLAHYWYEPLDIFESRMRLLRLGPIGVEEQAVYVPRRKELERLQGVRFTVTLLLELRDALAPRFQALVSWAGKLAVYLLTEVLGRGIGLIGRGIVRGVGSAWQDIARDRSSVSGPRR